MKRQDIKWAMSMMLFISCCTFPLAFPQDVAYASDKSPVTKTIVIENGLISVDLKGMTIKQSMQKLQKALDLNFYVDDSLSQEKLYVQFEPIPLHEGLMKIFYGTNYILCFQENGNLSEVMLVGKKNAYDAKSAPGVSRRKSGRIPRTSKSIIGRARQGKYVRPQ